MALAAPRPRWPVPPSSVGWRTAPVLALLGVLLGVVGGVAVARFGPLLPLIALVGIVGAALVLVEPRWGLVGTLGVITLLPFGTLPVKIALTPTLLECALGATWLVFAIRLLLHRDERLRPTVADGALLLFLVVTVFAFVLGIGRGYTTQTLHDYAKMVLSISSFFLVTNLLRTARDLRVALLATVVLGTGASVLGLGLYALGRGAERVLARLAIIGYPTGKIIRYIEDDPAKAIRATGTGVDPNSFAGLLMVVLVILVAQAVAQRPLVPRQVTWPASLPVALCLLLTQSRAAWLGAILGIGVIAVLRYRWMLPPMALAGPVVIALGLGRGFVQRLVLGFRLQDPATKLRLSEYQNALAIIREHPFFGVGFGAAPSIDQQTGVSSVYLTIAERTGFLGLGLFVVVMLLVAARLWPVIATAAYHDYAESEVTLALGGALVAALTAAVLDHYFFHIGFAHMVALFWCLVALTLVAARQAVEGGSDSRVQGVQTARRAQTWVPLNRNARRDG